MTLTDFLAVKKGLLIAPAGHGKTYTIGSCVRLCPDNTVQLVLTHTHAGIASLRNKFKKLGISTSKYNLETISGFAQKLVHAYLPKEKIPEQDSKEYFVSIIEQATTLLSLVSIQFIIKNSFQGVFVDEYQDCTINQHNMIMKLADLMPTHVFGDELQGIFSFAGSKIEFARDLVDFDRFDFLTEPWRWKLNGNCVKLGQKILRIRNNLLTSRTSFTLVHDEEAHFFVYEYSPSVDKLRFVSKCLKKVKDKSALLITPTYKDSHTGRLRGGITDRANMRKRMGIECSFTLLEAIDDKSFYSVARDIDNLINTILHSSVKVCNVYDVLEKFTFNVTELKEWISPQQNRIIQKHGENAVLSKELDDYCRIFFYENSLNNFYNIFNFFFTKLRLLPKRPELLHSLSACMKNAILNNNSVYDNMVEYKNRIRQIGRKVEGRCIGTTLLTKGLEFDTVIIVDAHLFSDKKNFYVAISRACKNLIILKARKNITLK